MQTITESFTQAVCMIGCLFLLGLISVGLFYYVMVVWAVFPGWAQVIIHWTMFLMLFKVCTRLVNL